MRLGCTSAAVILLLDLACALRLCTMSTPAAQDTKSAGSVRPALKSYGLAGSQAQGPAPLYDDDKLFDQALLTLFRRKLAVELGADGDQSGYTGLIAMIRTMNEGAQYPSSYDTQQAARRVLKSLFPSWLPAAFAVMFSKPLPEFSCRMNAWVTLIASQWLMGHSEINDVEIDGGRVGIAHGLLVKRCRYLEESGCASVCVNTCKVPTQEFFAKDMGLPLEMTPNYDDFSCQFSFGKTPLPPEQDEVFSVSCFTQCPSKAAHRRLCQRSI